MGGIGKTTLAKAAYNEFSDRFDGTCFLENFGESSKDQLQQKLLSHILRRDDLGSNNLDHEVRRRFLKKRVLVVIDDVKDFTHYNSIAIDSSCFGPGSRIIITGRDQHLLDLCKTEKIYSPETLNSDDSLKLVRLHAFRTSEPSKELLQLSIKLAEYCGGLPLAMEVLGTLLFKESTLESLKSVPNDNIQAKLQISFDALNEVQKDIFLDISCFFIGMDEDNVSCILDGCKFFAESGLKVLKNRCLITVRDNKLMMHDLSRDMGRQIVRGTSWKDPEKWSRLWDPVDVIYVLGNYEGTNATEGLSLKAEVTPVDNLEVEAFSELKKLRLLQLSHVHLKGNYKLFPKGLQWLCWFKFPLDSVPTDLYLRKLVVMDMQHSNLKRLWDVQKQPQLLELKYLDLSHSIQLTDTPDFSLLPNLKKLLLINCESLVEVHNSIGTLHKLVLINLSGCTELGELSLELYSLKSLKTLILSGCSKLARLDDALGDLESLTTLKADNTGITQIPSSTCQLKKIEELSFEGCKGSRQAALSIPFSLNRLCCLKTLRLSFCNLSDEWVPENLGSLSCLEELDLRGNNFHNLQTDFAGLENLQILRVDGCSKLKSMFSLPKTLRSFSTTNCPMLERTPDLSECLVLQSLHLRNCYNLVETPGLDKLKTVGVIHMEMCNRIPNTYRERIMQGWAVGANGGIFIPGSSLPNWVSFKNETYSISFTVPETLNHVVGFTVWTLYASQKNEGMSKYSPNITLKYKTKSNVWSRNPATDMIRMYREKHIWQGHFSNEDFFLETGDQVEVSVDFGDQVTILETGLTLAYREANTDISDIDNELVIEQAKIDLPGKIKRIEPYSNCCYDYLVSHGLSFGFQEKERGFEETSESVLSGSSHYVKDEEKDATMDLIS
ncbi:Disease resistance protein RPV1 [Cardamine amara subsp. amara]|uniref:Disease resistance protein RPV1 n=1 Tax=Cardamine amara subsp. amara TaxID=228776 RepID=A0ABD1BIL7_CARAN